MARFRCPSRSLSSIGSVQNVVTVNSASKRPPPARVETVDDIEAGPRRPNHQLRPQPTAGPSRPQPTAGPSRPQPTAGPSRPSKKTKGKARASVKNTQAGRVAELRKEIKKTIAQVKSNRIQWSFVFVGNLSSSVEKEHIWKHFSDKCGPIARIEIRASSGVCVPTGNLPKPYWGLGTPVEGVHYATIHFTTPDGARKAMDLSGTELGGRNIIVTFNVIDLPETIEIVQEHLQKKDPQPAKRSFWQNKYGQLKRLTVEKTEYISEAPKKATGPTKLVAGIAKRVGMFAAGGNTTAGDQNRNGHAPQRPLVFAGQITFPQTLI
ncbi:hypothetical protein BD311DRAFT_751235 [Dichomitus squalens]|uniref:RRM domain-containing protein n=1 Tax=Dichomitus squalens TaxID=114155 RepID=A0A4Q9MZN5_9APHY|nr:hypothetical protein BD311DRAFT_751235 [Dichomitus squalens]